MSVSEEIEDLTPRAEVFRSKLIDTFQLLDSLQGTGTDTPKYYSSELADSPVLMEEMMMEAPFGLIKFKVYCHNEDKKTVDRRLNKVRMRSQFGIYSFGPWAKEITENKMFQYFMSWLIVLNSLVLGIQSEMMHIKNKSDHSQNFMLFLEIFDDMSLVIFIFEIVLKLIDQPTGFWKNGWNNFDFIITMMTAVIAVLPIFNIVDNGDEFSYLGILKVFRILRSLKMLTRFAQLRLIVLTIIKTVKSLIVVVSLLLINVYLFAIFGLIFFNDYANPVMTKPLTKIPNPNRYGYINVTQRFGSFTNATIMVFQLFTVDSWHTLCKQVDYDNIMSNTWYVYFFVIAWLFIGAILIKNIFVGIMVMNFKAIRDDLDEQMNERANDLELGQKGLLLEVELAMQHARASQQAGVGEPDRRSSLECSGIGSNLIPLMMKAPGLVSIAEELKEDVPVTGVPFAEIVQPSLSDEELHKAKLHKANVDSTTTVTSGTSTKDFEEFMTELKETASLIAQDSTPFKKFPESASWNDTVRSNFRNFDGMHKETLWPRDTLFRYIQLMEKLQDNLAERHQLQRLSVRAISNMFDTKIERK